MTSSQPAEPAPPTDLTTTTDAWDSEHTRLQDRFPGQRDSVLFCVWKLQQSKEASLRDFRDEARVRGVPVAGRALHSAKVLLGLAEPAAPRTKAERAPKEKPAARRTRPAKDAGQGASLGGSLESTLLEAVRGVQAKAGERAERLRTAMREAITVLERALHD